MRMKLIEAKKNTNETDKTEFMISYKELESQSWIKTFLKLAGADLDSPTKQTSRNVFYVVDGDYINRRKDKCSTYVCRVDYDLTQMNTDADV